MTTRSSDLGLRWRTAARVAPGVARLDGDARWLLALAACVTVACALPYLVSAWLAPPDLQRLGTFWFVRDFSQYQAAMREGAHQSGWLIHDHFSVEPHAAALMYTLYVGAGKVAAALGLDPLGIFTLLEWFGRAAVVAGLYAFARTFLQDRRQRALTLLLGLGTLGLDVFAVGLRVALNTIGLQATWLPDTINPYLEISSFGVLLSAPHLMFALALTAVAAPLYLAAVGLPRCPPTLRAPLHSAALPASRRGLWLVLLAADLLALSLVQAFNLPVLLSVLVLHALLSGRRAWPAALVAVAAAAPMTLYSVLLYGTDPFWAGTYAAQNLMPSPPPWALPFDFGVVLIAAPLAWPLVRQWSADRRRLILLWVGFGLLWMYVPVPYQRRFAFGVQPGLAVLAAAGLVYASHRWQRRWRPFVNLGIAVAASVTTVLVYVSLIGSAATNKPAEVYLWSRPEAAAAAWLADHSSAQDVVLASTEFANPLAGSIDGRVVHGHVVATLHSGAKAALVRQFFASDTTPDDRSRLLTESGATIVAVGPRERALGVADLSNQPELRLVYDRDGVSLWRVRRGPSGG